MERGLGKISVWEPLSTMSVVQATDCRALAPGSAGHVESGQADCQSVWREGIAVSFKCNQL